MPELSGNLSGLRDSVKLRLLELYDMQAGADEFLPMELSLRLGEFTSLINREIAVYLSRSGEVLQITIGKSDSVPLNDFGQRRSVNRLSRVRCIHTHPGGDARLSDVDISALQSLRLDAICALGVLKDGSISGASLVFLEPDTHGDLRPGDIQHYAISKLSDPGLMEMIKENDQIVGKPEYETASSQEKVFLISVDSQESLDELAALCESADALVIGSALQAKIRPDPATYIGSGKASQIALETQALGADLLVVDDELSGMQTIRLEELIGLPIVDRTTLILDIFARRASTAEGKLQVSLAQLNYRASRLIGSRSSLSRLAGGIGTRGPGESKLEMDRRVIRRRIQILKNELNELERQRDIRKKSRVKSGLPQVALVGYTNTGKSTLLNLLSDAGVYVKDQLFATLDTVSRKITLKDGDEFLLTDSVGFISKLPTDLVEAFRSTLDEALAADILVIVSDASNPNADEQRKVVNQVLEELGATDQPRVEVYNKIDLQPEGVILPPKALGISAKTGQGIDQLMDAITNILRQGERSLNLLVPFSDYQALNDLRKAGRVLHETHQEEGTRVMVRLDKAALGRIRTLHPALFDDDVT